MCRASRGATRRATPDAAPGRRMRDHRVTMTVWLAILIPVLVMAFALGMERLETRLRAGTVREDEVEDFLDRARPRAA